jgi:hypothetical protein
MGPSCREHEAPMHTNLLRNEMHRVTVSLASQDRHSGAGYLGNFLLYDGRGRCNEGQSSWSERLRNVPENFQDSKAPKAPLKLDFFPFAFSLAPRWNGRQDPASLLISSSQCLVMPNSNPPPAIRQRLGVREGSIEVL